MVEQSNINKLSNIIFWVLCCTTCLHWVLYGTDETILYTIWCASCMVALANYVDDKRQQNGGNIHEESRKR